jgi:hypothetical protein
MVVHFRMLPMFAGGAVVRKQEASKHA